MFNVETMLVNGVPSAVLKWEVGPHDVRQPRHVQPFPTGALVDINWEVSKYASRAPLVWPDQIEFLLRLPGQ